MRVIWGYGYHVSELAERLGYDTEARLLIITCPNLGASNADNLGVYDSLRKGSATSAGVMVPCPWSRHAAAEYHGEDVGVNLTLNAEFSVYRWGPITHAPSLVDGSGGFPQTVDDLWEHADLDETRKECRAQLERAILWGFDVSHLGSHLSTLHMRPEFFDVELDLAVDYQLPLRLPNASEEARIGFPLRSIAIDEGIVVVDHQLVTRDRPTRSTIEQFVADLPAGVTEITVYPGIDTPELRALDPNWAECVDAHAMLTSSEFEAELRHRDVHLVGYRALRVLQRQNTAS